MKNLIVMNHSILKLVGDKHSNYTEEEKIWKLFRQQVGDSTKPTSSSLKKKDSVEDSFSMTHMLMVTDSSRSSRKSRPKISRARTYRNIRIGISR